MKFEEIIPALREGKKIRRRGWCKGAYISIGTDGSVCDQNNEIFPFVLNDFKSEFWEIIKEPKKVKLRDLTEEQYVKWRKNNCCANTCANSCPFKYINCSIGWSNYKEMYSDKFLDQEIEVEEWLNENI